MSKGTITKLDYAPEKGLSGEGKLTPSIPFLSKLVLGVAFGPNQFTISAGLDTDKISPPIPGAKITKAELALVLAPEFNPSGKLAFTYAPGDKKLADADLTITKDAHGLAANGNLNAYLPGVDQAKGTLAYSNHHLTGRVDIGIENLQKLGVTRSSLVVHYSDQGGFSFEGSVELKLPTGKTAELSVRKKGQRVVYGGKTTIDVPGLKPVDFNVEYDGEHFTGDGKTGFTHHGIDGDLAVHYRSGDAGPEFTGEGKLHVKHGKANGEIDVTLHKNQKFSGKGDIAYQLTENLIAGAGVVLDENGKLHVHGLLKFPKPIQLFRSFEDKKELFHLTQQIPIPGLSIGPVGVIAEIGVGFGVSYGIGPGELRHVQIQAGFDPLEANKNLQLSGGAMVVVPAHAGVYLSLDGSIGVGAGFASATGGLNVRGDASLNGQIDAKIDLAYQQGRFVVDATAGVHAGLTLKMSLGAFVQAHVGIGPFSAGTRKDWELASYSWGSGSQFGMTAPLHYASDEPFHAPTLDSIKFEKPNIDPKGLLANLFQAAPSREKEQK